MTSPKRTKILRLGGGVLMLSGLAALAWCGVSLFRTYLYQKQSTATLEREILSRSANRAATLPLIQGTLLGSVSIPRVGVSSVISEGADDRILALSVGHIPGTSLPGGLGNVALAGHRDTFFRGLRNIRRQDDILLTTVSGNKVYEVESARVVSPEDVSVLNDTGRPMLTLVTCYPFYYVGSAPKRFIVQARLVGTKESGGPSTRRLRSIPLAEAQNQENYKRGFTSP